MSSIEHNLANVNRLYQRGTHFSIDARLSIDGRAWKEAGVTDLSSGGLHLVTDIHFKKGDEIWLDLTVHSFFNEFEVKAKAAVMRVVVHGKRCSYGMAFVNLPKDLAIRIDEDVRRDRPIDQTPYHGE